MNKLILALAIISLTFSSVSFAQGILKGTVKGATTGETLIGASVVYATGKGTTTDLDGNFAIPIEDGEYEVTISYVGFSPKVQKVKIAGKPVLLNVSLESAELREIEIVADVARTRETPVAFTNISGVKIQEEAANRDLPMMLNSTPGVYATQQGGGMGDSRINIRGFDQRNVAVMVDGVPVNDMENGQVYWSNWDNLGDITRTMQVQRGLGASKLAIPSVGGTINIMTKGIDGKKGGYVKQEIGSNALSRTSFGFNSGRLKGGWAITVAGSYKRGDGWAYKTDFEAWGYFVKIQKEFKNQLLTFSVSGAPQRHGQRSSKVPLPVYNTNQATQLGIPVDSVLNNNPNNNNKPFNFSNSAIGARGPQYNSAVGYYYDKDSTKHTINPTQNYFHKPQLNLSHFWTPNSKFTWSNVAYLSIGNGGGEAFLNAGNSNFGRDSASGLFDFTQVYQQNSKKIDKTYDSLLHRSNNIIRSSVNNHFWYGLVSTFDYKPVKNLSILAGFDLRSYKGTHYQQIQDLFGGDYYIDKSTSGNVLIPRPTKPNDPNAAYQKLKTGDKFGYNNSGIIRWAGAFLQAEYKIGRFTVFGNGSYSYTGYKRVDYFRKKDLVLTDTTIREAVGWGDTLSRAGQKYTMNSKEARLATTDWKWFPGYTIKAGSNYNIDDHQNVFINAGILSIAPRYAQFYSNTSSKAYPDVKQQQITAIEVGYGFKLKRHAINFNLYYTDWKNKPPSGIPTTTYQTISCTYVLAGINTISKGVELDATGFIFKRLQYEAMLSVGDWKYNGSGAAYLYDIGTEKLVTTLYPNAKNVHTGDAAQLQGAASLRYEPVKGLYLKIKANYFGNNYSTFDPLTLAPIKDVNNVVVIDNGGRDSWKMPDYYYFELHAGYSINAWKLVFTLTGSIINLLDNNYISDAQNGTNFNATSASVFVAQGRRYNLGLKIAF